MSYLKHIFTILAISLATGAPAVEVVAAPDTTAQACDLQEVVVTGTRTPKMLKDTPVQTRLITSAEIRRSNATGLQDLLQLELPGIEFSYAMNQQVNMNLGGFSGQGVLILVDGERLAGETMENVDFDRLGLGGVQRIEIVRGAASAIYGSDATGGVINIITSEATRKWSLNLNSRYSRHNQWRAGGHLGLKFGKFSNTLDISHLRTDTYNVCLDNSDACDFRTVFGYHWWNFRDRLVWSPRSGLKLSARAGYFFKQRLYNTEAPDRYRDFTAGLSGVWEIDAADHLELSYAFDQYDKSDYIRSHALDIRDYSNVHHSWRGLYTRTLRSHDMLLVGADLLHDYLQTYQFGPGETHRQYTADIFAQYDCTIDPHWEVVGALRWDYYSDRRNSYLTAKATGRYTTGLLTVRGGYSGGFRAPTLKEKYMRFDMADIFDIHGNPALRAEKSHNFNLSGEYTLGNWYFTLGANYSLVQDRITTSGIRYDGLGNPYIDYLNVDRLNIFGLDAGIRARWQCGIYWSLAYNFTHEQTPPGSASQYCPARPHSLNTRLSWTHSWRDGFETEVALSGRFLSRVSYDSMYMYEPFETKRITNPAYTLWKLQLSQQLWRGVRLTVAVDNLLNYIPRVYSYNAPVTTGTDLQIGLSLDLDRLF